LLVSWRLLGFVLGRTRSQATTLFGLLNLRFDLGRRNLNGGCNFFAVVIDLNKLIFLLFVVFVIILLRIGLSLFFGLLGSSIANSRLGSGN